MNVPVCIVGGSVMFLFCLPGLGTAAPVEFAQGTAVGSVQHAGVDEASGLVASRANPGVLWTHNDSGDASRVYALAVDGTHLGVYDLNVAARDWEDMAVGPGPAAGEQELYLGDIGDNNAARSSVTIYRVKEPAVSPSQAPVSGSIGDVETFTLTYPDGARDAETLLVDPALGDLYVVSKREARSRVYRASAAELVDGARIEMECKTQLPWGWSTGGDVSPDGDEVLVRGYANAMLWSRRPGEELWTAFLSAGANVPVQNEPQGEAIAFDADGRGYYTVSEQGNQPIYYYNRIPEPATAVLLAIGAVGIVTARPPGAGPPARRDGRRGRAVRSDSSEPEDARIRARDVDARLLRLE